MKQSDTQISDINELHTLSEGDFVFVIDETGKLKTILVPEEFDFDLDPLPNSLKKILKIFGVQNLNNQTLH